MPAVWFDTSAFHRRDSETASKVFVFIIFMDQFKW